MTGTDGSPEEAVATALAGWSDERLLELLDARPDLLTPPLGGLPNFVRRLVGGPSTQLAYRRLDQFHRQIVDALCLLGGGGTGREYPGKQPSVRELSSFLGAGSEGGFDAADLQNALTQLETIGLVFPLGTRLQLVPGLAGMRYPAGLGPPAATVLARWAKAELAAMAQRLGAVPGRTKESALAAVAQALADPATVAAVVDHGPAGSNELAEALSRHPLVTVPGGAFYTHDRTPVAWFAHRGLLAPLSWDTMVMPREAGFGLRGGRPFARVTSRPPALATRPADPERTDAGAADQALRLVGDIVTILDVFAETPGRRIKTGGLGVRDLRRAAKAVGRPERETARIIELAGLSDLVSIDDLTEDAMPTPAFDEWMAEEPPARWGWLVARWRASEYHLSLAGALDAKAKPIGPLVPRLSDADALARRLLLLETLPAVPPGQATDRAALAERLAWHAPMLWSNGPAHPSMLIDWSMDEADLLGLTYLGALSTAGRLAAAGRLAEAAEALATRAPAVVEHFVVQADMSAMAPGELAYAVRLELELMADVESTGAATVFRFSESSIARALTAGRRPEEMVAFLERHATRGLPQPLTYLIADLGRRFGRVRIGSARCYLRSEEPSLLAELLVARRCRDLGLRALAPTVLVASADPTVVLGAVRAAGYLAAAEDADGGLVLARSQPGRVVRPSVFATMDSVFARTRPPPLDPAEVVAALRADVAPARRPPVSSTPPRLVPLPGLAFLDEIDDEDEIDDDEDEDDFQEVPRPTHIASGAQAVSLVVAQACEEGWLVRLAFTNDKGNPMQINAAVIDVDTVQMYAEQVPGGANHDIPLSAVRWARVMTTAEEDCVL